MSELVIIRGLPGSGKTTYARHKYPTYLHYDLDHLFTDVDGTYRYEAQLREEAQSFLLKLVDFGLSRKENIVVTEIFSSKNDLQPFMLLAEHYDVPIKIYTKLLPNGQRSVHNVPVCIMNDLILKYDYSVGEVINELIPTV